MIRFIGTKITGKKTGIWKSGKSPIARLGNSDSWDDVIARIKASPLEEESETTEESSGDSWKTSDSSAKRGAGGGSSRSSRSGGRGSARNGSAAKSEA